jgi:DNA-binding MarR family transcriptional regulator
MNAHQSSEREIKVLEIIYRNQEAVCQRDLARIVGLSLGMTNSIVKRLTQKGLLKIRKINNRNIHYIVSPDGVNAITKKSYRFVKRTFKNVVLYKEAIENLIKDAQKQGYMNIVLVGSSDIDFIIEHSCMKHGLSFSSTESIASYDEKFFIFGEDIDPAKSYEGNNNKQNVVFLRELLINRTR